MSRTATTAEPRTDAARLGSTVRSFALCMLAAVIASGLALPWSVGALVFTVVALVLGVLAMRLAVRTKAGTASLVWVTLGLALATVTLLVQVVWIVLWPVKWDYERCQDAAITLSAQDACDTSLRERLTPAGWPTP